MMSDNEVLDLLNGLIEVCRDAEKSYLDAAQRVRSAGLKTLFDSYARQRTQFAEELEAEVRRRGGHAAETGTVSGALQRGWHDVRVAMSGNPEAAIVSACERGEDAGVRRYSEALEHQLPPDVRAAVDRQYGRMREAHERIRSLEKATA